MELLSGDPDPVTLRQVAWLARSRSSATKVGGEQAGIREQASALDVLAQDLEAIAAEIDRRTGGSG